MDVPNNYEQERRIARSVNNVQTSRSLFRTPRDEEGFFAKLSKGTVGFFKFLFQLAKYGFITVAVISAGCLVFKYFLLFLISMQNPH